MRRVTFLSLLVFLTSLQLNVSALEVEKVFTISTKIRNANGGGFLRLEHNVQDHEFFVSWSVLGDGRPTKVYGAIFDVTGKRKLLKAIVSTSNFYDLAYNSYENTYLFVYQVNQTLFAQLLNHNLTKISGRKEIETSAPQFTIPEVEYDSHNNTFVVAWVGDSIQRKDVLYTRLLDAGGNPSGQRQTAVVASSANTYNSLRLIRDEPKDRFDLFLVRHQTGSHKLLAYLLGPEGTPVRAQPVVLDSDAFATATAAFRTDGAGLAVWIDEFDLEVRKLAATGGASGKAKKITQLDHPEPIIPPVIAHDSAKNHFLAAWTHTADEVRVAELTASGKRVGQDLVVSVGDPFNDYNQDGPEISIDSAGRVAFIAFVDAATRILVRGALVRLD